MKFSVIRVFLIFLTLLFSGIHSKRPPTCTDLQREITSREDEIERLKLTLEEYKLASDEKEDKSDECNEYGTCSSCLLQRTNSSCGWCVLHNRCSLKGNCRGSESDSFLWVSVMERCPRIRTIQPPHIPARSVRMLQVNIPLPEYYGIFVCSFEVLGKTLLTKGRKTNTTEGNISCSSPPKIPDIPENNVHLPVKLSVRLPSGRNFASTTDFIIYDCNRYTSCSECTSSPFPCAWCMDGYRCTNDVDENCRNDIIVSSKAVSRPTIREGPGYCTRVVPSSESNEIIVSSGSKKRIHVKLENIMQFQVLTRFVCEVKSVGQVIGQLLADTVYCDMMTFKVLDRKPITNLSFALYAGHRKIDNIQNLHVVVYHCGLLANSCGECLDLPDQFNCGWCEESNSCTVFDNCGGSGWKDRKQTCTKPKITSFYPKSGLLTRKTNITIKGINFGKEIEAIDHLRLLNEARGVDIECTPREYVFKRHSLSQIICELDVPEILPGSNETIRGFFELKIANKLVAVSDDEYSFVNPSLTRFEPAKGIKSGGTFLKIEGHHLDAGKKVDVFIGDLPCNNVSRDSTTIRCITSPSPRTRSSEVRVIFDGEEKKLPAYFFYVEDPYVWSVKSEKGANSPIGTLSGGNLIFVEGEYFDHVPNPYIYILVDGVQYPGGCTLESDKYMECLSPRLPADVLNFCGEEGFGAFDYGFRMGDVLDMQNISLKENFRKFRIYPDPFFMPFTEEGMTKIFKFDYLTINGRYLDTVLDERDITVHIGAEECVLTSLSHTQLTCRPPPTQPVEEDGDGSKLPYVVVKVHEKQEFFIGFLRYSDKE